MSAIVAALLQDPAIFSLHLGTIAGDVIARFGVSRPIAYRAVIEALHAAQDAGLAA